MILDDLRNADACRCLGGSFVTALDFIKNTDLAALAPGRHDVHGRQVYAIVIREPGRKRDDVKLEIHRRYADMQIVLAGTDRMGWKPAAACREPAGEYDPEKDLQFFKDRPDSWVDVRQGQFAVFFPDDAHAPMIYDGEIHKVVVKVAMTDQVLNGTHCRRSTAKGINRE